MTNSEYTKLKTPPITKRNSKITNKYLLGKTHHKRTTNKLNKTHKTNNDDLSQLSLTNLKFHLKNDHPYSHIPKYPQKKKNKEKREE